uniref:Glucose receptor Git3 N-terminal domain-containing protein n=1 Tax=Mycena chlorophos TaxID=658473 RepID=A0ABQ0LUU1_MYCCL|nr:predicted protein [Mycena chlorophos]
MAGPSSLSPTTATLVYCPSVRSGVFVIVVGGCLSALAILCLSMMLLMSRTRLKFANTGTHLALYFSCLLLSDTLQAAGAIMNLNWALNGEVVEGGFCTAQAAIKQAGNVSAAIMSFTIAVHVWNLLFMRYQTSMRVALGIVLFGWCFTTVVVLLGPTAVQTEAKGPFFGIDGEWCWIRKEYSREQVLLQYLFEAISVVCSLFLYFLTLLRVRGNLLKIDGRWTIRFLSKDDSWKLDLHRDYTDMAGIGLIKHMIWYPVAYMVLILPIAAVRISAFAGASTPFGVTVFSDVLFVLCGLVDVVLFVTLNRVFPELGNQPAFDTKRKTVDLSIMETGLTPFTLEKPVDPDARSIRSTRSSINSTTPLRM